MKNVAIFTIVLSALLLFTKVFSGEISSANEKYMSETVSANSSYRIKNYEKAFRQYFMLARNESTTFTSWLANNQNKLAYMYEEGLGTEKSTDNAIKWYEKGAVNNDYNSMNSLGNIYFFGKSKVPVDYKKAYNWYMKALNRISEIIEESEDWNELEQSEKLIKYIRYDNLGWMYLEGNGVNKDIYRAWKFFNESAKYRGDGYSYYMVGYMSEHEELHPSGTKRLDLALKYYNFAVDKGYEKAKIALDNLMETME